MGCWHDNVFAKQIRKSEKYEEMYPHTYEIVFAARISRRGKRRLKTRLKYYLRKPKLCPTALEDVFRFSELGSLIRIESLAGLTT